MCIEAEPPLACKLYERTKDKTNMKKQKIWSKLMLVVMMLPLVASCSSDDDDNSIPFTKEILVDAYSYWDIKDITGNISHLSKGTTARFYSDGTCDGFFYMETSYEIKGGKLYTYYAKTKEPMYVYTLLKRFIDETHDELTVRVEGTLDDNSTCTIIMRRNSGAASAK